MRNKLIILLLLLLPYWLFSQTVIIKGIVTDNKDGEKLSGASVISDQGAGTVTDMNGSYELSLIKGNHTLTFSYIGYKKQTFDIDLSGSKTLDVSLQSTEVSLNLITVSGSKYEKNFEEEVVSMEILKQDVIQNTNSSFEEALNRIPGVQVIGESASIRGGSGFASGAYSRVAFLVDGIPMLSPDNGAIRFSTLPTENIEQVEIIKGASSSLYGSSALNGIVNIITAVPKEEAKNTITANFGYYNQPRRTNYSWNWRSKIDSTQTGPYSDEKISRPKFGGVRVSHLKKYGNVDVSIGGRFNRDQSYLQNNDRNIASINSRIRIRPEKYSGMNYGFAANANYEEGEAFFLWSGLDSSIYIPSEIQERDQRIFFIAPFMNLFDKKTNRHALKSKIEHSRYDNTVLGSLDTIDELSITNSFFFDYAYKNYQSNGSNFIVGLSGDYLTVNSSILNGKHSGFGLSAYFQAEKRLYEKLTLTAGLRLEYFKRDSLDVTDFSNVYNIWGDSSIVINNFPVIPVFRFGANYNPVPFAFLRASIGQGYRFPSVSELNVTTQRSVLLVFPNPGLNPEIGWNAELGIKLAYKISDWVGYFDAARFYTRYSNLTEFSIGLYGDPPVTGLRPENNEDAEIVGLELSSYGKGKISAFTIDYLLGYTYMDHRNLNYIADPDSMPFKFDNIPGLKYRVNHISKGEVNVAYKKYKIGFSMLHNSFMTFIDGVTALGIRGIDQWRNENNKGFLKFDLRGGYQVNDMIYASIIAKNIGNKEYSIRPGILEAPRNITFQLRAEF